MNGTIAIIDAEVLLNVFQYKVWILFFSKLFAKKNHPDVSGWFHY